MAKEFPELERGRPAKETSRQHIPTWMIKRASALEKEGQEIADLFGSINRFNAPKVKEEIETKFPAWVKQVEILSAQIFFRQHRHCPLEKRSCRSKTQQPGVQ